MNSDADEEPGVENIKFYFVCMMVIGQQCNYVQCAYNWWERSQDFLFETGPGHQE